MSYPRCYYHCDTTHPAWPDMRDQLAAAHADARPDTTMGCNPAPGTPVEDMPPAGQRGEVIVLAPMGAAAVGGAVLAELTQAQAVALLATEDWQIE